MRDYRFDLGGRLARDLAAALPRKARRVWVTGVLELASEAPPLVEPVGTYPRVRAEGQGRRTVRLHAATPEDLALLGTAYVRAGSAAGRAEFAPDEGEEVKMPALEPLGVHPVTIPNLPSLSGLLVQSGQEVAEGEPLALHVDDAPLEDLDARARLEERRREGLLEAERLTRKRDAQAKAQFVRSPVARRVTEVRVLETGVKGITVQIMLTSK